VKPTLLLTAALLFVCASARAALNGPAIPNNNYSLDLRRGAVVGGVRKIAMGGANIALTSGAESLLDNPAAVAFREKNPEKKWDWDFAFGLQHVGGGDYDNNGDTARLDSNHGITNLGFVVQRGRLGLGLYTIADDFDLTSSGRDNHYRLVTTFVGLGGQTASRQWSWGAGFRIGELDLRRDNSQGTRLLDLTSGGMNVGVLWHPHNGPFRLGASFASRVKSNNDTVPSSTIPVTTDGLILPRDVVEPRHVGLGVSYEWRRLTMAFDVRASGKVDNAVGIASVLEQKVQRSGENATVGYHGGIEWEAVPHRARLRLGGYHEPARFGGVSARDHATGGFELRAFSLPFGKHREVSFSYAFDVAHNYSNNVFGLGLWF
jgi:hypothetical protein